MKTSSKALIALVAVSTVAVPAIAQMRRNIRIVGSSTVYPFSRAVAEHFARANPGVGAPIVESTGTGAGMKLFCGGVGASHPDITNASRRIKASEFKLCQANGVSLITEIAVGLDGVAKRRTASRTPPKRGKTSMVRCPRRRSSFTARHQHRVRAIRFRNC